MKQHSALDLSLSELPFVLSFVMAIFLLYVYSQAILRKENEIIVDKVSYEQIQNDLDKVKFESKNYRNETDKLKKELQNEKYTLLHYETTIALQKTKIDDLQNRLKSYEHGRADQEIKEPTQEGKISDIPPDCSRVGLIQNYLFEAVVHNSNQIIIKGSDHPINIDALANIYSDEIKRAKENLCVHKVIIYFDKNISAGTLYSCETKLRRYFYVLKESL